MSQWVEYFKNTDRNIYNQSIGGRRLIDLVIANTPKGGRILEAGCGTALLSLVLADYGYDVTALDYEKDILDYARTRMCADNIKLKLVQGDIMKLSSQFGKSYFETICHSGVMEHFSDEDIIKSLSEQRAISKRVIFNVPNGRIKQAKKKSKAFGDERLMSNAKWVTLIKSAGFKSVKVYGGYDLPKWTLFVLPGVFFHKRGSFWWKWFSKHSLFVCE